MIAASVVFFGGALAGAIDKPLCLALLIGGLPIAWVGFIDDCKSTSVRVRFFVQALSSVAAIYLLGGLPAILIGEQVIDLGIVGDILSVIGIIWAINLFNFMDGIDGIAASEAIFVAGSGGLLYCIGMSSQAIPTAAFAVAGASAGFLSLNWPPARIFMGDVGSGYLGFVIATLAIAAGRDNPAMPFVWLILGTVFFADATVTVLRRFSRGERVSDAHRSHAYQWWVRRWQSHRRVTIAVWLINVLLILPAASLAVFRPALAAGVALVAVCVGAAVAWILGAGQLEVGPAIEER